MQLAIKQIAAIPTVIAQPKAKPVISQHVPDFDPLEFAIVMLEEIAEMGNKEMTGLALTGLDLIKLYREDDHGQRG